MTMDPITIVLLDETEDIFIPTGDQCINEVLVAICEKHGLNPQKYVLSYNNYFLTPDFLLKTLNLKKDEQLKLVEDFRPFDESITITLRVKDSHISAQFNPDVTLLKVVENLVAGVTLRIPFSTPILIRKRVEYIGQEDLMKVTPRSLGVTSGHLSFRFLVIENATLSKRTGGLLGSTDSLQFELSKDVGNAGSFVHKLLSAFRTSKEQEPVISFYPGIARRNSSVFGDINYLGERNAVASRIPDRKLTPRQKQRRDNFYNLHVKDVKTMVNLVREKRKELHERLIKIDHPIDQMSEPEKAFTVIRIQFPDKTVLQGFFDINDTIHDVAEFVKLYRRIPKKFHLATAPPKVILHSGKTLLEYGLVPTGKVFYKVAGEDHPANTAYLKECVLRRLTTHEGACYAAALCQRFPMVKKEEQKTEKNYSEEMRRRSLSVSDSRPFMLRPFESRSLHFRF